MIELVFMVCQIANPSTCKDVRLSFVEQFVSVQACMFNGQVEIAKWVETHPDWQVTKWGCARAGIMAKA